MDELVTTSCAGIRSKDANCDVVQCGAARWRARFWSLETLSVRQVLTRTDHRLYVASSLFACVLSWVEILFDTHRSPTQMIT